ncbi:MAG: alkaline shock response membrane anchor protein AmaP [Chloroflexi bacterium]|nr:alkaline shock response membrane anchor protein AmaP [Chloroflexota bacterium]
MNLFNRIAVVIVILVGILASIVLIIASITPEDALASLEDLVKVLEENISLGSQILVAVAAALVAIAGFLLLLLEVVPRSAKGVRLTGVTGASAQLTVDAIVNRIRYEVESVPGVQQVRPTVAPKGQEVDVVLELFTDITVDVASKTEDVSRIVRDTVENKLGVKTHNLKVYVRQGVNAKADKGQSSSESPAKSEAGPIEPK